MKYLKKNLINFLIIVMCVIIQQLEIVNASVMR